jgi:hypothetical protein
VSLELPWNPARLEQRIGRVDRLGQVRPSHFTLLVSRDPAEAGLLRHLSHRALSASRAFANASDTAVVSPAVLARALFADEATVSDSRDPAPLDVCRRWRRNAIVSARALVVRRRLAARHRSTDTDLTGVVWAMHPRLARVLAGRGRACLVYAVPLLSDDDELVDQPLVAVRVTGAPIGGGPASALRQELARVVALAVGRRLARVARRSRLVSGAAIRRERALARALVGDRPETQPRLFDRREVRDDDRRRADRERVLDDVKHRINAIRRRAGVRAGAARLVLALVAP